MKNLLLVLVTLCLSCTKVDILRDVPDCIESKVKEFARGSSTCDSGAEVSEYEFQNKVVFTFSPGNCGADMGSEVYDAECKAIGFLGGFDNILEVRGEVFAANAIFLGKVWEN